MRDISKGRRGFVQRLLGAAGLAAAGQQAAQAQPQRDARPPLLPPYARAQNHKSLKQSSFDTTGGNRDFWNIAKGDTREVFKASGSRTSGSPSTHEARAISRRSFSADTGMETPSRASTRPSAISSASIWGSMQSMNPRTSRAHPASRSIAILRCPTSSRPA